MYTKFLLIFIVVQLASCIPVAGHVVAVYPNPSGDAPAFNNVITTDDSFSGDLRFSFSTVWKASVKTIKDRSALIKKTKGRSKNNHNKQLGRIKKNKNGIKIIITIKELDEHNTNLKIVCYDKEKGDARKAKVLFGKIFRAIWKQDS